MRVTVQLRSGVLNRHNYLKIIDYGGFFMLKFLRVLFWFYTWFHFLAIYAFNSLLVQVFCHYFVV
jgi:hypothetical protein